MPFHDTKHFDCKNDAKTNPSWFITCLFEELPYEYTCILYIFKMSILMKLIS